VAWTKRSGLRKFVWGNRGLTSTGLGFGNTGTHWRADSTRHVAEKFMATHGVMGRASLHASKQFDERLYWAAVAEAEVMAMFSIEVKAKDFLARAGETGELKLDLLPMCTPWDQTASTRHRSL